METVNSPTLLFAFVLQFSVSKSQKTVELILEEMELCLLFN